MVTLIALRIGGEYGILKDQVLRFDDRYLIDITQIAGRIRITIEKNDRHIPNFFGSHLSSMTAIVGKNGVGKSTMLRYIKELFIRDRGELQHREDDIVIFSDEGNVKILANGIHRGNIDLSGSLKNPDILYYHGYPKIIDKIKNFTTVYYSNAPDLGQMETESKHYFNISTGYLLENIGKLNATVRNRSIRTQNAYNRYRFTELKRQIEFFRAINENYNELGIPFRRVDRFQLKVKELPAAEYRNLVNQIDIITKVNEKRSHRDWNLLVDVISRVQEFFSQRKKEYTGEEKFFLQGRFELIIAENIMFQFLHGIIEQTFALTGQLYVLSSIVKELASIIRRATNVGKHPLDLVGSILDGFFEFLTTTEFSSETPELVKWHDRNERILLDLRNFDSFIRDMLTLGRYENNGLFFDTVNRNLDNLLERYFQTNIKPGFLRFEWPNLSAGEESLLAFFSRLHQVAKMSRHDNMILLIDEGELYFHPEWQRKYIFYFLNYLQSEYIDFKYIQVILTTHSPFIVADIPQDNIIFLQREENEVHLVRPDADNGLTFGGNLHALYANAFFLGANTTSEFAMQKIKQEIINPLNSNSNNIDFQEIRQLIDLIGEPVIKMALEERLKRRQPNDTNNKG